MTNVNQTPRKRATRRGLFALGVETLANQGWDVSRVARGGKASLRQIKRGGETLKVSIRTSQDTWIAFPRKADDSGWVTLDDVDYVVAVSVDDRHNPREARVHMIPGDEARARFNRAYDARRKAGHIMPTGRGIWLSLYDKEAADPVSLVGAGMGLDFPEIETRDITTFSLPIGPSDDDDEVGGEVEDRLPEVPAPPTPAALTIPEAKRLLAQALGVPAEAIKITIEH